MSKVTNFFQGRSALKIAIIVILILAVCAGAIGGIVALTRNTDKIENALTYTSYGWTHYRIGGLDGSGKYMSTDKSVYTKNAFECQGLNVTPVFDNDISYQIYFYDQNNEFVHTTGRLTGTFTQDSIPFFAKYARIVVTPNNDNKVTLFELRKYANQLETTVYREQGFKNYTENLFKVKHASATISTQTGEISVEEGLTTCVSEYINISAYNEALIFRTKSTDLSNNGFCVYDRDRNFIGYVNIAANANILFQSSEGIKYYSLSKDAFGDEEDVPYFIVFSCSLASGMEVYCR